MEENISKEFSGGFYQKFKDPAMDNWVTTQSLNQTCSALDEVQDKLENKLYLVLNLILGLISTYFLSIQNWLLTFILLIILEISIFFQIKKYLRYKRELYSLVDKISKICKQKGIKLPSRTGIK